MFDVCIIGAGPAGISSAVYAVSRGLSTLVLEQKAVGGLIGSVSTVTHYAGILKEETGATFAERLRRQAEDAGAQIVMERAEQVQLSGPVKVIRTGQHVYEARAVIIAGGTVPRKLGIPGEEEFAGRGTGLNAARDGQRYAGREMFVVGGADGAVKEALYLSRFAKKLTIIHFEDRLGAIPEFYRRVEQTENIELMLHSRLTEVRGNEQAEELTVEDVHTGRSTVISAGLRNLYLRGLRSQYAAVPGTGKAGWLSGDGTGSDHVHSRRVCRGRYLRQAGASGGDGGIRWRGGCNPRGGISGGTEAITDKNRRIRQQEVFRQEFYVRATSFLLQRVPWVRGEFFRRQVARKRKTQ